MMTSTRHFGRKLSLNLETVRSLAAGGSRNTTNTNRCSDKAHCPSISPCPPKHTEHCPPTHDCPPKAPPAPPKKAPDKKAPPKKGGRAK